MKVGRNDPCPCGSGRKYKHCCYDKDLEKRQEAARAAAEEAEQAAAADDASEDDEKPTMHDTLVQEEKHRLHETKRSRPKGPESRPRVQRGAQRGG